MNRIALRMISLLAVLALFSVWAFGQADTGTINGVVTDKSGAVVTGANVTAKSVNTGATRNATTTSAGEYTFTNLKPDSYDVTIEKAGFQKYVNRVTVLVGSKVDLSAQLNVTGASTTVEVTASGEVATVNTENQTLSTVVTSKSLTELPTLTRNPYDLVATSGNVTEDPSGALRGANVNINGARNDSTNVLLDGADNMSLFTAGIGQSVPLDSVQEFSVLTNNFTAEYGRASGGVVNVATKSGTNAFHGTLYEFNRLAAYTANTYQNDATKVPKPGYTRNQFGYAIGGPIVKNKLFFFSSTEWLRVRSNGTQTWTVTDPSFVPLTAKPTQDFFAEYAKLRPVQVVNTVTWGQACSIKANANCAMLPANTPFAEEVAYNSPSDAGGGSPVNSYSTVARVDYNWTDKTTLYGRYALYSDLFFNGSVNNSPYIGYDTGQTDYDQNVNINLTHLFTPSLVNSLKLNYVRLNGPVQGLGSAPLTPGLFSTGSVPSLAGLTSQYVFPGYVQNSTANAIPFGGPQNLYQLYDDLSWTKGKHQMKFGGSIIWTRDNRVFGAYENGVQILGNNLSNGLVNLVNGNVYQFQTAIYPQGKYPCSKNSDGNYKGNINDSCLITLPASSPKFNRNNQYTDASFYAQDSWKVSPRVTLNLGLRWEYYGVQHNSNPSLDSNFYLGAGANVPEQIRNGKVMIANQSPVGGLWHKDKDNFAPRVGFAWDVFGNGTTSLRGGYGIGYERNFGNVTFNVIQNPPNYAVVSVTSSTNKNHTNNDVPFQPVYVNNLGAFGSFGNKCLDPKDVPPGTSCIPNVTLRAVNPNINTAYSQFWSMAMDHQIMRNSVLSVEYSGSKGSGLYDIANVNTQYFGSTYLGDTTLGNRLNYQYGNINFRSDNGYSNYNAVNIKFQSNNFMNKGLQVVANYTWSHSTDNASSTFTDGYNGNYFLGYTNAFNPTFDKGNSDYNVPNRFVVSAVWDLPWMKNASNAFARQALGGWQFSPIFKVRSGYPYNIYDGTNAITIYPRWIAGAPVSGGGSNQGAAGPNLFNYLPLPQGTGANPNINDAGLPAGTGNALQVPTEGFDVCPNGPVGNGTVAFSCTGAAVPHRNSYSGPGYWNVDMVIAKMFKLTERFSLQFRGEFYDMFNHHNLYINAGGLDIESGAAFIQAQKGGIYGYPGSPTDERRFIQFGLKLLF